jgi:hypothetical protein
MGRPMAYMIQAGFGDDDDDMPATRSQSLSADYNRLTIKEHVSSPSRSGFIHGSSSTTIIPGDLTVVDNNLYQSNFDSHKRNNNIVVRARTAGECGRVANAWGVCSFCSFLEYCFKAFGNSETEVKASSQSRETIEFEEGSEEDLSMYAMS